MQELRNALGKWRWACLPAHRTRVGGSPCAAQGCHQEQWQKEANLRSPSFDRSAPKRKRAKLLQPRLACWLCIVVVCLPLPLLETSKSSLLFAWTPDPGGGSRVLPAALPNFSGSWIMPRVETAAVNWLLKGVAPLSRVAAFS